MFRSVNDGEREDTEGGREDVRGEGEGRGIKDGGMANKKKDNKGRGGWKEKKQWRLTDVYRVT